MPKNGTPALTQHADNSADESVSRETMRIDGAHHPHASPVATGLHQRPERPVPDAAPTPFAWQDLNLSSEKIAVEVRLGSRRLSARELESLKSGRVVRLESPVDKPVEIRMDQEVMAYGRMVIVDGKLAIQITELRQSPRRRTA